MADFEAPQEIRCECSRQPLLAKCGIEDGVPFLWVRHVKGQRTVLDMRVIGGKAEIVCRECLRTWTIKLSSPMEIAKPK